MTPEQTIRRAERMAAFLDDEDVRAVFDETRAAIIAGWERQLDPEARERAWFMLKAAQEFWARLEEVRDAGKVAEAGVERRERERRADEGLGAAEE